MIDKIILGTVQLGIPYGISNKVGQPSLTDSFAILNKAFDHGISILDTADAYGSAHEVIGQFHQAFPDRKFRIITKLPHEIDENFNDNIHSYLKILSVDSLHGLLFHTYNSFHKNINHLPKLFELKRLGIMEKIGVSIYTNEELEKVLDVDGIDIIQLPYNVFDNLNLRGSLMQKAKSKGIEVHTRSCFLQGLLFQPENSDKKIAQELASDLKLLREISIQSGFSIQELALLYCLQEKNVDQVLIGVDSIPQLLENLEITKKKLPNEVVTLLNTIKIENISLLNPSTWSSL